MASDDRAHDDPGCDRFLRATIADGEITLNPPLSGTITGGPASMTFARLQGVAIVDLRFTGAGDDEVVATVPPNAPRLPPAARRVLGAWAALVGYRRLWLPDGVVELEPPAPVGTASVRCPTCTSVWADDSARFWTVVRESGHFPAFCPACAGSLPEWRLARPAAPRGATAGRRPGAASAAGRRM